MEAKPEDDVGYAVAPVVAASKLKSGLNVCVGVNGALVTLPHLPFQLRQLSFQRNRFGAAGEDVIAQRQRALARRPLVVER